MYQFRPPIKNRFVYIIVNGMIIITFFTLRMVGGNDAIMLGLSLGTFFLFNGVWSMNRKNFSLIHRDDKNSNLAYGWIIAVILGALLVILCLTYLVISISFD